MSEADEIAESLLLHYSACAYPSVREFVKSWLIDDSEQMVDNVVDSLKLLIRL